MVDSRVYPKLERVPGIQNWVDKVGGLPDYIERIAKHLHYEKGMSISRAIATAVNTVKRWARMGKVAKHGDPNHKHVTAKTAALAAKAVAEWEAKKTAGKINLSEELLLLIDLTEVSEEYALHLADELGDVIDLAVADTREVAGTGAQSTAHGRIRPDFNLSEGGMDLSALAERANAIEDPIARSAARRAVLELAVPAAKLTVDKRKGYAKKGQSLSDGSFPVFDATSLKSAIRLARTPAQRAHICKRAQALGLMSMIPSAWPKNYSMAEIAMQGIVDLASTIAPRNLHGRVSDGRRSYKKQGHWKHGFIPVDTAASESKAKGSPIAMRRLARLYGNAKKKQTKAATGRAGQRSAPHKNNAKSVTIDEKAFPGSESAKSLGSITRTPFDGPKNKNRLKTKKNSPLPSKQLEASKSSRVPNRARQNWDEIPSNLKTVRNGTRYVYAEYGGKGYITPWVGGVHTPDSTPLAQRKVYRTLSTATASNLSESALRDIMNNPKTSPQAKAVARKFLKKASVANRTKEASQKP